MINAMYRDLMVAGMTEPSSPDTDRAVLAKTDLGMLWLHAHDKVITPWISYYGTWERELSDFLRHSLTPGMNAIDIGANIGYQTILMAGLVGPSGHVVAIEPEPHNVALLRANVAGHGGSNTTLIAAAVADFTGMTSLSLSSENTGAHRTLHALSSPSSIDVRCVRIDDLLDPAWPVDLIKMDIQGSERVALRGMERTLERYRPIVVAEFWPRGIREMEEDEAETLRLYRDLRFTLSLLERPEIDCGHMTDGDLVRIVEGIEGGFGTLVLTPC